MRIHLLSIFAFAILAFATPARAYDPEFSKIVSYSKLMTLSPEKRAEYIRQVRLIVSEFEEIQKNISGDSTAVADTTERNLFLDMMIRDANAAVFLRPNNSAPAMLPALMGAYRCPSALTSRMPKVNRRIRENGAQLMCLGYMFKSCSRGFYEIGGFGGKRVCYKPGLTDQQVAQIRAQQKKAKPGTQKQQASLRDAAKREPTSRRAVSKNADSLKKARDSKNRRGNRPMPSEQSAEQLDGIGDADAVQDSNDEGTTADEDQHRVNDDLPEYRVINDDQAIIGMKQDFVSASTDDFQCKDEPSIEPPETCNDTTIAAARREYFRVSEPHCIFAGNLRHYSNNQKRPGMCQHPREFCLSNVACRNADNSLRNPNEKIQVKCKDQKQILCNPLLFNLDERDEALCVPSTRNATAECNKRAAEVTTKYESENAPKKYVPFISRLRIGTQENQYSQTALNGIKEAWDSFADNMNSICTKSPSKDLYCRECQIMKTRAAKLNLLTFKPGVHDADGNCYQFDHIKVLENDSTTQTPSPASRSTNGGSRNAE